MKPSFYQIIGNELSILWEDGHESYYPLPRLRRNCPCAFCSGEPDLFGRIRKGPAAPLTDLSFQLTGLLAVGNYGLQPEWADSHAWGIWTWEKLREACRCAICHPCESG